MALTQISSDGVKDGTVVNADINASAAIAFSKLQDVSATDRILGRDTAGAGDIEEITPANVRTMLNVEDGADVTDSTNVNSAGAVMNSDLATKGQILIGDGSGDPTALAVGTNDYVLTADSGEATGVKWAAGSSPFSGSGVFRAGRESSQTVNHNTLTIVEYADEDIDVAGWYDNSTYKYTPQTAGYYHIHANLLMSGVGNSDKIKIHLALYKNTNAELESANGWNGTEGTLCQINTSGIIQLNGSSDYVQVRVTHVNDQSGSNNIHGNKLYTYFTGHLVEAT